MTDKLDEIRKELDENQRHKCEDFLSIYSIEWLIDEVDRQRTEAAEKDAELARLRRIEHAALDWANARLFGGTTISDMTRTQHALKQAIRANPRPKETTPTHKALNFADWDMLISNAVDIRVRGDRRASVNIWFDDDTRWHASVDGHGGLAGVKHNTAYQAVKSAFDAAFEFQRKHRKKETTP